MYPARFMMSLGLMAFATAQYTAEPPEFSFEYGTTITVPGPSGTATVYNCSIEVDTGSNQEEFEAECDSISDIVLSTSSISSRASAQPANPTSALEARMQRKFGVEARQDNESQLVAATTMPVSCGTCDTATVTSTSYLRIFLESCSPLPTPPPSEIELAPIMLLHANEITNAALESYELSLQSADRAYLATHSYSDDLPFSAEQPAPADLSLNPIFVSVLTADVTKPTASGAAPFPYPDAKNATIAAPTLGATVSSGILSPPVTQTRSIGHSIAVGILANVIVAAGIAYLFL